MAETWNGTSWSSQTTPNPVGAAGSELLGVSCISGRACTGVGRYEKSAGTGLTLAEGRNAATWSIQTTGDRAGATHSELHGVSCASATACIAVGSYNRGPGSVDVTLAERWNGTDWSIETTADPKGAGGSDLVAVSCTSPRACTAVGSYLDSAGISAPLAEVWNGTSWSIENPRNPGGSTGSLLFGVSCTSARACTAVGSYNNRAGASLMLAERWNGTSWSIQTTPEPAGATSSELSGVSCISAHACTAVGSYGDSSGNGLTLAEAWNGTTWQVQTTPNPAGGSGSRLTGVSCTSPSACTAVGSYVKGPTFGLTMAESWNGSTWSIQAIPDPSGEDGAELAGVSCSSAIACVAVGYYFNSSNNNGTVAESWDGTRWRLQSIPIPAGTISSDLFGVSCPSPVACTAVGIYQRFAAPSTVTLSVAT